MMPLLLIHAAATWALVGLIWTIQCVHYPLFADVGRDEFARYHHRHVQRITWLVGPVMILEAGTALSLLWHGERSFPWLLSLAALVLVWGITAIVQVPLHRRLSRGTDPELIRRLVRGNLWRSIAWTVRGVCLIFVLLSS
jgi:hypothetical protein